METRRILVTGGTGFVGRHLASRLLADGHQVTLAVRKADGIPVGLLNEKNVRIVATGPLETASNLADALHDVHSVIHIAGLAHTRRGAGLEDAFTLANAVATERLTQAAADAKVSTFIHASSLAAITPNASLTIINDETDTPPTSPYGRSKRIAERHVLGLADKGIFAVSLRPPLVVGADARGNWGLLQRLAMSGLPLPFASVRNRRSLVSVDTLARAIMHLSVKNWPVEKSGNYCFADRQSVSLPNIVAALRQGMELLPRMFAFPPALLNGVAGAAGRRQMAAGLLGNLEVDASRFSTIFDFEQGDGLTQAILESGAHYRRMRNSNSNQKDH